MNPSNGLRLERLGPDHDLSEFDCGNDDLNDWFRRHGLAAQQMDSARTFVLTKGRTVVGYFSLTMGSVLRADAPKKLVRGLPAYPVGMVLLARLAVHRDAQRTGLGGLLLSEALRKAVVAGEAAAARLVVVDAIDDAAVTFYERHGFIAVPDQPYRLYRRMKEVRASLDTSESSPTASLDRRTLPGESAARSAARSVSGGAMNGTTGDTSG